jgi:RNA polymerase sigma-70 factor (ECF subfamily)
MEENIEEFIKGNKKAFDWVYEKYAPSMFGICMRYANCRDDAQEILQETFIKVYENRGKMNPQLPLAPWIKTITIRTAINFLKSQKRMVLKENDDFFEAPQESLWQENEMKDEKNLLLKLLTEMPAGYRTVFNLFVLDNLTHKEIAEHLDISEGASKSQLSKAKNWIKINLEKKRINERA